MKIKGFTLIELLAVIVILAIIALIATPIILSIINDARRSTNERSIEMYASAVKNAVATYHLKEGKAPITFEELEEYITYEGAEVVCDEEVLNSDGSIYLASCKVGNTLVEGYTYGEKQESNVAKVCSIEKQDASKYSKGDVVTCSIGEIPDKFYVIADAELSSDTIQMLTEKNIHTTEYRQSDSAGTVAFSSTNYWSSETVDVYNASNDIIKPIVDEYVDYLNIKLTNATGSLLTYSQAKSLGCDDTSYSCPDAPTWVYSTPYWTGSANIYSNVLVIDNGYFIGAIYDTSGDFGVRPVITILTSEIQQ